MIEEYRFSAECRLVRSLSMAVDMLFVCEILAIHAEADVLVDGRPDWRKTDPVIVA